MLDRCLQELNSQHHDEVAEGLATLGRLLGFESQRPRGSGMPDTLWRYARDQLYIITIEVKAELEEGRPVALRDVNQAHGQSRWAQTTYGSQGFNCIPLLVSRTAGLDDGVSDRLGSVRCLTQVSVIRLAEAVRSLFEMYRSNWSITRAEARANARQILASRIPQVTWLFDAYRSSAEFISEDALASRWRSQS